MAKYESVPVPFIQVGKRRALSDFQLMLDPSLVDFVRRFASSFEYDPVGCYYFFIEPRRQVE